MEIRPATPEDAAVASDLLRWAFDDAALPGATSGSFEQLLQTGSAFLVLEDDEGIQGLVRYWDDEGIGWFDRLVSTRPGLARRLVRAVETGAQDRGIRYLRLTAPGDRLPELFSRWGYRPVARTPEGLVLERRLPLLTVREQRREDAAAIGEIAAIDPWPLEQRRLPGWFVLSDGDTVVGVVRVEDVGAGRGRIPAPILLPPYHDRGLDLWMIERATLHAETEGFHTLELPATPELDRMHRDLEDRRWFPEGPLYVKKLASPTFDESHQPEG